MGTRDPEQSVSGLEVLSEQECRELLASRNLGRIAFSPGGKPEIFPVNYIAKGSFVVFRTAEGTRLQDASMLPAAFEVDDWDPSTGVGWSVVVHGVAQEITTGIDTYSAELRKRKVVPLAPGARELWMAVYPDAVTGRRFRRT